MERETGIDPAMSSLGKRSASVSGKRYRFPKRVEVDAVSPAAQRPRMVFSGVKGVIHCRRLLAVALYERDHAAGRGAVSPIRSYTDLLDCSSPTRRFSKPLRLHPVVELIDPVVARCALFRHTKTVAARFINMHLGLRSGRGQCPVEPRTSGSGGCVVLSPGEEDRWQV